MYVTRRYCIKTAKRRITQTTPRNSPGSLVFDAKSRWWTTPFPWNLRSKWPTPFQTAQFRPILVHSASTVRAGEKVQLALIGSRPRAYQRAMDEPCTLPLTPPKGGTKRDFAIFPVNFNFGRKNVSYKVSLCEKLQRQSCSYIIPLFNGP